MSLLLPSLLLGDWLSAAAAIYLASTPCATAATSDPVSPTRRLSAPVTLPSCTCAALALLPRARLIVAVLLLLQPRLASPPVVAAAGPQRHNPFALRRLRGRQSIPTILALTLCEGRVHQRHPPRAG